MHRSRSRGRPRGVCDPRSTVRDDSLSYVPVNADGYAQLRKYIKPSRIDLGSNSLNVSPTVSNSTTFDFKSSSNKETKTSKTAILTEQSKRSSPNVVAKLMGLDSLPSPRLIKPQKEGNSLTRKVSSKESQKSTKHEDCLLIKHSEEYQECKDVFEVNEMHFENHTNHGNHKPDLKQSGMDMAFIRQSFINAKRLSTDEKLQRSKEFDDALEVLESNKDLFLKLLQEPHSLFSKHLQNQSHLSSSSHASQASIRKSSRDSLTARAEPSLRSDLLVGRHANSKISDSHSLWQHLNNSNGHSLREPTCSLLEKYSDKDSAEPTHIVILKPSLKKTRKVEKSVRSVNSLENSKYGVINHKDLSAEKVMEFYREERERKELETLESMKFRAKHSTNLPKNAQKYGNYVQDEDLWAMSNVTEPKFSRTSYRTNFNEFGRSSRPSPSCAIESLVNMEARKHLSEQQRLAHYSQELGLSMRACNTLSDMLALSDREIPKIAKDASIVKKFSPSGISSKDGWKDGFSSNISKPKSLQASPLLYVNSQHKSRIEDVCDKSRIMDKNVNENHIVPKNLSVKNIGEHTIKSKLHSGEEYRLLAREIHASSFKHRSNVGLRTEEESTGHNFPDMVHIFSAPSCNIAKPSFLMRSKGLEKLQEITSSERNGKLAEEGVEPLLKQASSDLDGPTLLPSNCSKPGSFSPTGYKEADQPSPVSVLDLSSKDNKSSSQCFKKINADLQELRRQLQLLKFDSENSFTNEIEDFVSSDEDRGDMHQSFRDEEDRDYSYLLDMLIDSGRLKSEKNGFFGACQLTQLPVSLSVLDKLEKKYKLVESWSRSERRLLFDIVNSTMSEMAEMPFLNIKPRLLRQSKMGNEGLVEEIWQAVVKRRKEVSSNLEEDLIKPKLFDFENDEPDLVGTEMENLICEDLMDEMIKELIM